MIIVIISDKLIYEYNQPKSKSDLTMGKKQMTSFNSGFTQDFIMYFLNEVGT